MWETWAEEFPFSSSSPILCFYIFLLPPYLLWEQCNNLLPIHYKKVPYCTLYARTLGPTMGPLSICLRGLSQRQCSLSFIVRYAICMVQYVHLWFAGADGKLTSRGNNFARLSIKRIFVRLSVCISNCRISFWAENPLIHAWYDSALCHTTYEH